MTLYRMAQKEFDTDIDMFVKFNWFDTRWQK